MPPKPASLCFLSHLLSNFFGHQLLTGISSSSTSICLMYYFPYPPCLSLQRYHSSFFIMISTCVLFFFPCYGCISQHSSYYIKSVGRRKSWVIPTQLLCGILMIIFANSVDQWMGSAPSPSVTSPSSPSTSPTTPSLLPPELSPPPLPTEPAHHPSIDMVPLSAYFCFLYFLLATQDVAVDAMAINMLHPQNVGWASTSNTIGQFVGIFISHTGFLVLSSPDTCNKWIRPFIRILFRLDEHQLDQTHWLATSNQGLVGLPALMQVLYPTTPPSLHLLPLT